MGGTTVARHLAMQVKKFQTNKLVNISSIRCSCTLNSHIKAQHTVSYTQNMLYSSRTTKAAIKAYHKTGINGFVYNLSDEEREELHSVLSKAAKASAEQVTVPSKSQLRYVALFSGVPFIGFGLLDNTIMLTAGEYIDITFGTWLGITTMAAAALGNMISDILGITTAGFVEQTALKLGLKAPSITLEQMSLRQTRWMANLGRCIGVCIGCVLGMWPLLVFSKDKVEETCSNPNPTNKPA